MITRILAAADWAEAAKLLRAGGIVALPTETVYGLAARLDDEAAIRRIFHAKGRPIDNPLIVHVADWSSVEHVTEPPLDSRALKLRAALMPGPLTLVLRKSQKISTTVTAGLETVAVRWPDHTLLCQVINAVGVPLVAPSANRSGKPSPTQADHVLADLDGKIDAVLDGGPCRLGLESTVVKVGPDGVRLLRPGAISQSQLEAALGEPLQPPSADDATRSPGLRHRHYAPNAKVMLVSAAEFGQQPSQEPTDAVISRDKVATISAWWPLSRESLFDSLRQADAAGCARIWVIIDEESGADTALMDRLRRAADKSSKMA